MVLAMVLAWLGGINPFAKLFFSEAALFQGIVWTLPMILLFGLAQNRPEVPFQKIRRLLLDTLGPGLYRRHWSDLLMLASIAGISEEVLFRGVIQPWIETLWGMQVGLIACNVLFGFAHAITPLYTFLAFLIGMYLSLSMDYGGDRNLLIPMVIHTVYDFWAFIVLMREYAADQGGSR